MVKLSHSYSSLKQYEQCPLRYKYQRITKEVKDKPGEASIYGERVHQQLEDRLKAREPLPTESAAYEVLCSAFEDMPGELWAEQAYTLNEKLEPTGWWDDDAWLRSKLDVLVLDDNRALVADWKTGKYRPDFNQLELFALQVFSHHPEIDTVQAAFIWLKDMKQDYKTYKREDTATLWARVLARINMIEVSLEHNNWPARASGLCPWCPAFDICDYAIGARR